MRPGALAFVLFAVAAVPLRAGELADAAARLVEYGSSLRGSIPLRSTAPELKQGEKAHIFDTSDVDGKAHYVNDHTIVRGRDGKWHLFGIYRKEPFGPDEEREFVHAVHEGPLSYPDHADFTYAGIALRWEPALGETHIWAPHVVDDGSRYVMVYQSGGPSDRSQIRFAESSDLDRWQRLSSGPAFEDVCVARDPMLVRLGSLWVLYYTRCDGVESRKSGVAFRTSNDLRTWSEPRMALVINDSTPMSNSGYTESPYVFERSGWYYLSVTSYPVSWDATFVFRSRSPFSFSGAPVARLPAHAAEWLVDDSGRLLMTHCGAGQKGVWLAPVSGF